MQSLDHTYVVILAGGGGTRLWPKSRNATPKQFLKLTGTDTMMQTAAVRISQVVPWERIIVVTNQQYIEEVQEQLPQVPKHNIIAEPKKRDTALAMLVGTLYAKSLDPQAVVANQASDHVISDDAEFIRVIKASIQVAQKGDHLVTVGITPTFPSSGFGYIKIGQDVQHLENRLPVFSVENFTEKPNTATARAFISTGRYFWNANMYVWKADVLIDAFKQHMPSLLEQASSLLQLKGKAFHEALPKIYEHAEAISIDYAISEKADNLVLIPGDFGWNDVGDWKVVYDLSKKDLAENVIMSEDQQINTLTIESRRNLIHTNGRLVALLGVEDMIVIDTPEIVMILPKSRSQDVKKIVERLKEEQQDTYL